MTTVRIREWPMPMIGKHVGRYEIEIKGHVQRRDPVKNDACVAASMLTQTFIETLRNHEKQFVQYHDKIDDDAYAYVLVNTDGYTDQLMQHMIEFLTNGFHLLKELYPDDFIIEML